MLMSGPCLAADDFRVTGDPQHRMAAFAGASIRVPMGNGVGKPTARLQLTMIHSYEDRQSASPSRTFRPAGFELGASGKKAPALFLNGQDLAQTKRKLGANGSSKTWLIVGGVLLAGAVAILLLKDCDACDRELLNR